MEPEGSLPHSQVPPPIYAWVSQVVSFPQVSPPKPCICLSSPPYALYAPPISFFVILSPEHCWEGVGKNVYIFLISNFRHVLNAVCLLLGSSPASDCYMPTFWNTRSHLHRQIGMKNFLHTYLPMKMEQCVLKRWHVKFRRQGSTKKKASNMSIYSQKPKSSWLQGTDHVSPALGPPGCSMWPVATFVNIYRVSIKSFPDYKHLLQENYRTWNTNIYFFFPKCNSRSFFYNTLVHFNMCSFCCTEND